MRGYVAGKCPALGATVLSSTITSGRSMTTGRCSTSSSSRHSALALHALQTIRPARSGHRRQLPSSTELASILTAMFSALIASVPRMRMVVDSAHARLKDFDELRFKQMFRFRREHFVGSAGSISRVRMQNIRKGWQPTHLLAGGRAGGGRWHRKHSVVCARCVARWGKLGKVGTEYMVAGNRCRRRRIQRSNSGSRIPLFPTGQLPEGVSRVIKYFVIATVQTPPGPPYCFVWKLQMSTRVVCVNVQSRKHV
jgi:hypothetical protein